MFQLGTLGVIILVITGFTLLFTIILLIVNLRSKEDTSRINSFRKSYISMIIFCVLAIMAVLLINRIVVYMHQYM